MIKTRLHTLLGERRKKVAGLANLSGVSYPQLHRLYHGRTTRIDLTTLNALCNALEVTPNDLLHFEPDGKEEIVL